MSSVEARTGRHRQRYENNFRLVSGAAAGEASPTSMICIPYRITEEDEEDGDHHRIEDRIQVLMVSSPDRDDRVFPKGGWEDDETVLEAACREALEEAGVKGTLRETPLGVWEFRSKSRENVCSLEGGCRGYMFALEVTEELETWPEQQNRDRKWLNIKEAFRVCRYEWMCRALEQFLRVMTVADDNDDGDGDEGTGKVVDDEDQMMMGSADDQDDEIKAPDDDDDHHQEEEGSADDDNVNPPVPNEPMAGGTGDDDDVVGVASAAECQIMSSKTNSCSYVKTSSAENQHRHVNVIGQITSLSWHVALKRLPLT